MIIGAFIILVGGAFALWSQAMAERERIDRRPGRLLRTAIVIGACFGVYYVLRPR